MGVPGSLRSSLFSSLFLHVLIVALFWFMSQHTQTVTEPARMTWIELEPESATKREENRPVQSPTEEKLRRQLVQTEEGKLVEKAVSEAFLGERTQVVEKQTVNTRRIDDPATAARSKPARDRSGVENPEESTGFQPKQALANLGLPILPTPQRQRHFDDPHWAVQGSGAFQDYVRGIEIGDRTALNTKEYVFFGYFQRIRERLDRAWVPILRHKLITYHRTGRKLASDVDYATKVLVTLNGSGEIVRVQVLSESGTRDLDEAAISAFNKAGPFPNPPKGIIDGNGEIQIPWEFVLKT